MFEIGPALKEARERKNLTYGQVEADTAIRTRYIRALEEEQFHVLPGATYTKGFLRAYADYLGLDGQLFIDEFNSRHHDPRALIDQPIASRPRSRPAQHRQRRESSLVMIVLAAIVALVALVMLATTFPNPPTARYPSTGTAPNTESHQASTGHTPKATHRQARARPRIHVIMTLARGTWIRATAGSPTGAGVVTARGTDLGSGVNVDPAVTGSSRVEFTVRAPIFLRLGDPAAVTVITANGKQLTLPADAAAPKVLKLTAAGITVA